MKEDQLKGEDNKKLISAQILDNFVLWIGLSRNMVFKFGKGIGK